MHTKAQFVASNSPQTFVCFRKVQKLDFQLVISQRLKDNEVILSKKQSSTLLAVKAECHRSIASTTSVTKETGNARGYRRVLVAR